MTDDRRPPITTNGSGVPVASDEHSLTVGPTGPTVLHDAYTVQKMQHFNRERVPERVVHAKGSGAHGFFEVTADVSQWTKVAFLAEVGRRTPVFLRFSAVAGELGAADTQRDPRGFAIKFYTSSVTPRRASPRMCSAASSTTGPASTPASGPTSRPASATGRPPRPPEQ
jgi:catalase